jgi:carbamoyltransferase
MNILGISAFYHDSAACLVRDGEIVAAAQEERFTRKKHDFAFPKHAISYCLHEGKAEMGELDYVTFYEKPFIKFERILDTYVAFAPFGIKSYLKAVPLWVKERLWMKNLIQQEIGPHIKILFTEHHISHAASAFYPSPFNEAAILSVDGVGEWDTATCGIGIDNKIELWKSLKFPHSLGLLYAAFTYYIGFKINSGEYKLMGLAPYGEPKYVNTILDNLIDLKEDGSFKLNMKYFSYCTTLRMINRKFCKLFGVPPRRPESKMQKVYMDIARSIQYVTEEIMLRMTRHLYNITKREHLCLGGGVALNCVANGRMLRETPFKDVWIQPGAGDAGGAIGAALYTWHHYLGNDRAPNPHDSQKGSFLGPEFSNEEIQTFLDRSAIPYETIKHGDIPHTVAKLLDEGSVVGWFQGRMEFGPRALGSRSILGDARVKEMQSIMNLKIKFRESFRPFAPSVLEEKVSEYFELSKASPYMLLVAPVRRGDIPAVTHVDNSARIQTVSPDTNKLYHDTIKVFYEKTGCPVIINTSFNIRGEPVVCTPQEAFNCFINTAMDYVIIGDFLLDKKKQDRQLNFKEYVNKFERD